MFGINIRGKGAVEGLEWAYLALGGYLIQLKHSVLR
jgi:hypothetical protein